MSGGSVLVERPRLRTNFFGTKNDMSRSRQSLSPSPSTPTLRRGISFTQFAKIKESTLEYLPSVQSKGTFTEGDLVGRGKSSADRTSTSSGTISPDNDPPTPPEPVSISAEHSDRGFPAFLEDVKAHEMFNTSTENFQLIRPEAMEPTLPPSAKGKLRRRSWMAPVSRSLSRPTSPKRTKPATETISENEPAALGSSEVSGEAEDMKAKKGRRNSWMTSNTTSEESEESDKANMLPRLETQGSPKRSRRPMSEMFGLSPAAATSEKPSLLSLPALNTDIPVKQSRRPLSGIFSSSPTTPKRSQEEPRSAPPVSIAKSFSLDRMPSLKDSLPSFDRLSNLSRVTLDDRTSFSKRDLSRGRDELWTAYKSLDVDFSKWVI